MPDRNPSIARAVTRDFAAVDALIHEGAAALPDVMNAITRTEVSTADTLGEVVRRIATKEDADLLSTFVTNDAPLEAFTAGVDALARVGDPKGHLQVIAESPETGETRRGLATRGIGFTGDPGRAPVVQGIAKAAEEAEELVLLTYCIEALTALGDHSLDSKVAGLLRSRKVEPKLRAAAILPCLFYPELLELLDFAASHRNAEVRRYALEAFYYLGTRRAATAMAKLLRDRDATTRESAIARLAWITGSDGDDQAAMRKAADGLADDQCHRGGQPIEIAWLLKQVAVSNIRPAMVEELRVMTGEDFAFNPSRSDNDAAVVQRIGDWAAAQHTSFERGACYKSGHKQDLGALK